MNRAISPALPLKREWKETAEVACSDTRPVQGSFLTGATLEHRESAAFY